MKMDIIISFNSSLNRSEIRYVLFKHDGKHYFRASEVDGRTYREVTITDFCKSGSEGEHIALRLGGSLITPSILREVAVDMGWQCVASCCFGR